VTLVKVYPEEEKVDILESETPMTLTMKDNRLAANTGETIPPPGTSALKKRPTTNTNLPPSPPPVSYPPMDVFPPAAATQPTPAPAVTLGNPGDSAMPPDQSPPDGHRILIGGAR
jgi:hypothetical protein